MTTIIAKKHRLPKEIYQGHVIVAFTACLEYCRPTFTRADLVTRFATALTDEAAKHLCSVLVYLFMPDHVHIVLRGDTPDANPLKTIVRFKQKTGYWLSKNGAAARWQKSFYDHVIRDEKDLNRQIRYILNNPVRGGIVTDWMGYPFKGSTIYDLNNFS